MKLRKLIMPRERIDVYPHGFPFVPHFGVEIGMCQRSIQFPGSVDHRPSLVAHLPRVFPVAQLGFQVVHGVLKIIHVTPYVQIINAVALIVPLIDPIIHPILEFIAPLLQPPQDATGFVSIQMLGHGR
jgi:hypothetical protein